MKRPPSQVSNMDSTALVKVENLSRFYQNQCAINQLSFSLEAGEVLGFLGPNGAGKTTTMQIITGNLAPSEGQVSINGFDIIEFHHWRNIDFVFLEYLIGCFAGGDVWIKSHQFVVRYLF